MDIEDYWKKVKSLPDWLYFTVVLLIALGLLVAGTIVSDYIMRL